MEKNLRVKSKAKKPYCVITGGHFTPALTILDILKEEGWSLYWIGVLKSMEVVKNKSLESKVIPSLGIPFYPLETFKINRSAKLLSFLSIFKILGGIWSSLKILRKIKPGVMLSFGSFVSVPVAISAWILGIPIVIHEQTATSGLANRIVGQIADKIAVSFKQSLTDFPPLKTVLTGNLVRKEIYKIAKKRGVKPLAKIPVLYITGGSRGSQTINSAVLEALPKLVEIFYIIHQTGDYDFQRVSKVSGIINLKNKSRYEVFATGSPGQIEEIYSRADIVVSRSGANTISELAVLGIPSVLIPLPDTESDEQYKNAKVLADTGIGRILSQEVLNGKNLISNLSLVLKNFQKYQHKITVSQKLIPPQAGLRLVSLLKEVL